MIARVVVFFMLTSLALSGCGASQSPEETAALKRLIVKDACTALLLTYGEGIDERSPEKISQVFARDGVWTADGQITVNGREKLHALWVNIASTPRPTVGRHAISNIRFNVEDDSHADGEALVVMHRYNPEERDRIETLAAMMLVEITMQCVRTPDEGWKFQRMELTSVSVADYVHGEG